MKFNFFLFSLVFDEYHRIMYCPIQKISSTTWLAVTVNNSKTSRNVDINTLITNGYIQRKLQEYDGVKMQFFNKTKHEKFRKFMIVRNPFDRLVSAYRDKAFPVKYDGKIQV